MLSKHELEEFLKRLFPNRWVGKTDTMLGSIFISPETPEEVANTISIYDNFPSKLFTTSKPSASISPTF